MNLSDSLIERFEDDGDHGLSLAAWVELLWQRCESYRSDPAPFPVHFHDHEHRIETYRRRAAAGVDLFHEGDLQPRLEDPADDWSWFVATIPEDDLEGAPGPGAASPEACSGGVVDFDRDSRAIWLASRSLPIGGRL